MHLTGEELRNISLQNETVYQYLIKLMYDKQFPGKLEEGGKLVGNLVEDIMIRAMVCMAEKTVKTKTILKKGENSYQESVKTFEILKKNITTFTHLSRENNKIDLITRL